MTVKPDDTVFMTGSTQGRVHLDPVDPRLDVTTRARRHGMGGDRMKPQRDVSTVSNVLVAAFQAAQAATEDRNDAAQDEQSRRKPFLFSQPLHDSPGKTQTQLE